MHQILFCSPTAKVNAQLFAVPEDSCLLFIIWSKRRDNYVRGDIFFNITWVPFVCIAMALSGEYAGTRSRANHNTP
jgi:hypothetical protein